SRSSSRRRARAATARRATAVSPSFRSHARSYREACSLAAAAPLPQRADSGISRPACHPRAADAPGRSPDMGKGFAFQNYMGRSGALTKPGKKIDELTDSRLGRECRIVADGCALADLAEGRVRRDIAGDGGDVELLSNGESRDLDQ